MVTLIKVWELGMDMNMLKINKQLQKPDLSKRELTKILFNTLRDENKLAIKMIVREYQQKQRGNNEEETRRIQAR